MPFIVLTHSWQPRQPRTSFRKTKKKQLFQPIVQSFSQPQPSLTPPPAPRAWTQRLVFHLAKSAALLGAKVMAFESWRQWNTKRGRRPGETIATFSTWKAEGDTRGLTILGYPFLCHSICINGTFASCGATTISNLIEWVRTSEAVFKRRL